MTVDFLEGNVLPLPANAGRLKVEILAPPPYQGNYAVQTSRLTQGRINLRAARIEQAAGASELTLLHPGLWAYDDSQQAPSLDYQWQRDGAVVPNATSVAYELTAADSGSSLSLAETATDVNGALTILSNAISAPVVTPSEPFAVVFNAESELEVFGNDGRMFSIDMPAEYAGTYSIAEGSLDSGPVALIAPVLSGDIDPAVNETLTITPALFAFDPSLGAVTVSYTTTGTNTVVVGDGTSPPTLLIDAADEGSSITVTATATQGADTADSVSNDMDVPSTAQKITQTNIKSGLASTPGPDTTRTDTIDLTGVPVGAQVLVFTDFSVVTATIDGDPTTFVVSGNEAGGGGSCFSYIMPNSKGPVTLALGSSSNRPYAAIYIENGIVTQSAFRGSNTFTTPVSSSLTVSNAENLLIAFGRGYNEAVAAAEDGANWTVVTPVTSLGNPSANFDCSIAVASDLAIGNTSPQFSNPVLDGITSRIGLFFILAEPTP